jgi:hypothetical protein
MVSGGAFRIIQAWPAPQTKELSKVTIEGTPTKLFVHGKRALIFSSLPSKGGKECTYGYSCSYTGDGTSTKITVLDISDYGAPEIVRELRLSGSYIASRRVGAAVHTVLASPAAGFPGLSYSAEGIGYCDTSVTTLQIQAAYTKLRKKNTQIIMETPLGDWLPSLTDTYNGESSTNLLGTCQGFYRAARGDGTAFTTVLSLDMTQEAPAASATIVSRPGVVYVSPTALYVAVSHDWSEDLPWFSSMSSYKEASTVHMFALKHVPPAPSYVASGVIKGRVLNQFSLDEWSGHLRIATTTGWTGGGLHNSLTVLKQAGGVLLPVGFLDKLAPTEDIRSVRFTGERGYIVTFKKTDPLFVIDLADPTQPKVMGELKIPGFSTYMHSMDGNHLITIGYDAQDEGWFAWFSGVQLQIFDVTVMSQPKLLHKEVIGTRGTSSEALNNHLAFTYFPPKSLLALPMTICEGGDGGSYGMSMTFSGLLVYDATVQSGFSLRGKVMHSGPPANLCNNWWADATSVVKRSIIMDDYVFSISSEVIKVNNLADLSVDVVTLSVK